MNRLETDICVDHINQAKRAAAMIAHTANLNDAKVLARMVEEQLLSAIGRLDTSCDKVGENSLHSIRP